MALLEAQAAQIRSRNTRWRHSDVLQGGVTGILIPPKDPQAIAEHNHDSNLIKIRPEIAQKGLKG